MRSHDKILPLARSFRNRRKRVKKLSISASKRFRSLGSGTVSDSAFSAFRIWNAATLVEAFSNAYFATAVRLDLAFHQSLGGIRKKLWGNKSRPLTSQKRIASDIGVYDTQSSPH